jgi:hypothetical protein
MSIGVVGTERGPTTGTGATISNMFRIADIFKRLGSGSGLSITSGGTAWTPTTGKVYRLLGGIITSTVAGEVVFTDSGGSFIFSIYVLANTPQPFAVGNNGYLSPTVNNTLTITLSAATAYGTMFGTEE